MQTRTDIIAALLFGVIAIACGEERSPWSGFPLFPEDAGLELSPELESSLRAAQIAFVTQLAAEQAKASGATAAPEPSPSNADAGKPPQRMAAEMAGRPGNGAKSDEPRKRENAPDPAMMAGRAAPDMHNEPPPMRPSAPSPETPMAGQAGSVGPITQPTHQPSEPDAGVMMSAGAGAGAMMTAGAGAGAMMTAGTGGSAGMMAPSDDPMQLDAAVPPDDDAADGGI